MFCLTRSAIAFLICASYLCGATATNEKTSLVVLATDDPRTATSDTQLVPEAAEAKVDLLGDLEAVGIKHRLARRKGAEPAVLADIEGGAETEEKDKLRWGGSRRRRWHVHIPHRHHIHIPHRHHIHIPHFHWADLCPLCKLVKKFKLKWTQWMPSGQTCWNGKAGCVCIRSLRDASSFCCTTGLSTGQFVWEFTLWSIKSCTSSLAAALKCISRLGHYFDKVVQTYKCFLNKVHKHVDGVRSAVASVWRDIKNTFGWLFGEEEMLQIDRPKTERDRHVAAYNELLQTFDGIVHNQGNQDNLNGTALTGKARQAAMAKVLKVMLSSPMVLEEPKSTEDAESSIDALLHDAEDTKATAGWDCG